MTFSSGAIGLAVAVFLGVLVTPAIIDHIEQAVRKHHGEALHPRDPGGRLGGAIECAIFFASFAMDGVTLLAAWLVFKTAAKWKTWDSTEAPKRSGPDIPARYRAFLVGTGANILAALAGMAVAKALTPSVLVWIAV